MNIKFVLVAAASALTALPSWGQTNIPVMANTNLTVSGLLTVHMGNSDISQGNAATGRIMPTETGVYDNTSRVIISSNSKITEGWNVIFTVESRFMANVRPGTPLLPSLAGTNTVYGGGTAAGLAVNDASGWADGETYGGVSSPYGTLTFGKAGIYWGDTLSAGYLSPVAEGPGESYRVWTVTGQTIYSLLSGYQTGTVSASGILAPTDRNILGNTRATNLVRYTSPVFKPDSQSLLLFTLAWSKNPAGAQNMWVSNANGSTYEGGQTIYGKAVYNGHGFSASASYLDQKFQGVLASAANTELKANRLGLSYKWEGLKFGVVVDSSDMVNGLSTVGVLSDAKRTTYQVPISYSFGDHAVYATYTKAGDTSSLTGTGAKGMNYAYDYALTKRAFVGIIYSKLDNDANAYYQPFLSGYSPFGGSAILKGESWRELALSFSYWF